MSAFALEDGVADHTYSAYQRGVDTLWGMHVDTQYVDPGSPWQNAYSQNFNSILRATCLDRWLFCSMTEAQVAISQWFDEYNTIRSHGSLGGMNPEQFLQRWTDGNRIQQPQSLTEWLDQQSWDGQCVFGALSHRRLLSQKIER